MLLRKRIESMILKNACQAKFVMSSKKNTFAIMGIVSVSREDAWA